MGSKNFRAKSASRLSAVQALFQIEQSGRSASAVIIEFLDCRLGFPCEGQDMHMPETTFFSELVQGASADLEQLDTMIAACLKEGWSIARLSSIARAILRMGAYELKATQGPVPVIINEYLDIARAFDDDKEVSFVNSILDKIAKQVRAE